MLCDIYSLEITFLYIAVNQWHKNTSGWGWSEFVSLAKLEEAYLDKQGYLKVEIEFEVFSTITYSP